ncbi:MAG TPA: serpin family protein [Clostridiales bacterium]|nr:serpin family protein [Clostridiales bacterium]
MKRIISMLISIIIVACLFMGCVGSAGNGNNRIGGSKQASYDLNKVDPSLTDGNELFAFDIFKELNTEDADKNIFISPLSISTALAMTYNGAGSTTKEAMGEALRYRGIELENLNTGYKNLLAYLNNVDPKVQLNISNSIWFRKGEEIKQDFLSVNKDNFNAYITEMDFQDSKAADTINGWISKATKGKIDKMIEPPISHDVIMYLINAIYFKGQWTKQFDKKLTFTGTFNTEDGQKKEVQMMHRKGKIEYGEVEKSKIVRLPYGNEKTAMYCILPETGIKINDFIRQLSVEKWIELKDSLSKVDDVVLQLPKFKMEYGIKNLNDSLTALGMGEAFSDSADFSGIRDDICISRVLHKAVIEVNEEGSEAAGATVVEMKETAAVEPVTFIGDRPFIFIIADDETGSILFMGKFME